MCWPQFDSPSLFGALLDPDRGGSFRIAPSGNYTTSRRYMGETNVLETTFRTDGGTLRIRDLMPAASEREKARDLWPDHQVLRALECVEGAVDVEILCDPRPDYGARMPRWRRPNQYRYTSEWRSGTLLVHGDIPLEAGGPPGLRGRVRLQAGEHRYLSICHSAGEPATIPPVGQGAEERIALTLAWWTQWSGKCRYDGPWREAVVRSALTLKLLTYAPSGALIAAPTTSLPEKLGGTRNWDYRYCWLRDASMTLQTLFDLGYDREGAAYMSWLLHSTRLTRPELGILYDVYGRIPPAERTLDHLRGYAGSRPVRVGNDARNQIQLDVYGEVVDAVYEYVERGGELDPGTRRMVRSFGEYVCKHWDQPDHGIWEIRSEKRHHVHSRAMCWVALDRLLRLHEGGHLKVPVKKFREVRDSIAVSIESGGWNAELGSYVSTINGDELDAVLLRLGRSGYADPASDRMRSTIRVIYERLGVDGLLYRYLSTTDGLPPGEGTFGICSFWGVIARALAGDLDAAVSTFEDLLGYANDLGLYAEEIDPVTGAALGNFPQAFTHVGLVDAVLTIQQVREGRMEREKKGHAPEKETV